VIIIQAGVISTEAEKSIKKHPAFAGFHKSSIIIHQLSMKRGRGRSIAPFESTYLYTTFSPQVYPVALLSYI
jgi:hypothetical protein